LRAWRVGVALMGALLVAVAAGGSAAARVPASASGPTLPSSDPFYTPPANLAPVPPGTVLRTRSVAISGALSGFPAIQVLYRTTGELGEATATAATIIEPQVPLQSGKLISWQTFYDGLGPECRPSYTLQGGDGGYDASTEEALMLPYLLAGYPLVTSDYEGEQDQWDAVQESGRGTLDGIRAAEAALHLPASAPVGMIGYSGGAIATEWAAELAPSYAPELNIVAAADGGVQVDPAHNLYYINGSPVWSGVIPPVLMAMSNAFKIDFAKYASPYGLALAKKVQGGCINNFLGAFPGLKYQQLLKPQYQNIFGIRAFAQVANEEIMGTGGTPRAAMFLANGNADGTGDDVMIAGDVEGLAHTYCQRGVDVQFSEYQGDAHEQAAVPFEAAALPFLTQALSGVKPANGCASIGTGNSLAPLPLPPAGGPSCPAATGALRGGRVGRARLGLTRAAMRRTLATRLARHSQAFDVFCLSPNGLRVGYATPALLRTLPRKLRGRYRDRAVLLMTANPRYELRGIRAGDTLAAAARHARLGRGLPVGRNTFYLLPDGAARGVLEVEARRVVQIGVTDAALTRTRAASLRRLRSFG
jgi:hypothetical protein